MKRFYEKVLALFTDDDRPLWLQRTAGFHSVFTDSHGCRSTAADRHAFFPAATTTQQHRGSFCAQYRRPTTTPSTRTPHVTDTAVPTFTPTFRPTITLEPIDPTLFTPSPNLFLTVQRTTSQLVWGGACAGERSIRFTAQVQPARRLRYVTLWYRLQDKYSGAARPGEAARSSATTIRALIFMIST